MRRLIFGGANSLDNFIARRDHAVDWLQWSDEVAEIMAENWRRFDTVLMGRKTYEVAVGFGTKSYPNVINYVFSRTLTSADVEVVATDAVEFVRALKLLDGKDICLMGGGELAKSLFDADLIDEIGFNIQPVLLGSGIPLFYEMKRQIDLELLSCRVLKNGGVCLTYRVKHAPETK